MARIGPRILAPLVFAAAVLVPTGAGATGGLAIPSTGTIGTTGYFLSCRATTSLPSSTPYYDQQNVLRTWDCGSGMRPHKGLDILGPSTSPGVNPVYAAASGTVMTLVRGGDFGWYVVLRHGRNVGGNGLYTYTLYGHMGDCSSGASFIGRSVVPGAIVRTGQLLGYQGNDMYPDGCVSRVHVHFEIRAYPSDVSSFFFAVPASPDFYTGVALTADDSNKATAVRASQPAAVPLPLVFRSGVWYLRASYTPGGADFSYAYGNPTDVPVTGDWNGSGTRKPGVFRGGVWYLRLANGPGPADLVFRFGDPGDVPVVGDWNHDGVDTVGVFRAGVWYLRNGNSSGPPDAGVFTYGNPRDAPVTGDWNRDGTDTIGVFRSGVWYLTNHDGSGVAEGVFKFGQYGDVPVVGDWNHDGTDTLGVFRSGTWYLSNFFDHGTADVSFGFGMRGDAPRTWK